MTRVKTGRIRRATLICAAVALSLGVGATASQALVVDQGASGVAGVVPVADPNANYHFVAVPNMITPAVTCSDNLGAPLPATALCFQPGGHVLHSNETFALYWDPLKLYWESTRDTIDQFLQDVATASQDPLQKLGSPYAVTTQYSDGGGRAMNNSSYGGAITDFSTQYPANGCPVSGTNPVGGPYYEPMPNLTCLTDAQIQGEIVHMITANGLPYGGNQIFMLMTPPGVRVCLDGAGNDCSLDEMCAYHSVIQLNGQLIPYVVQPWIALAKGGASNDPVGCDETDIKQPSGAHGFAVWAGERTVTALSAAHIDAITDPYLNGWYSETGYESSDNGQFPSIISWGCQPLGAADDSVTLGTNNYEVQRTFNNGGAASLLTAGGSGSPVAGGGTGPVMPTDVEAPICASVVQLLPAFVSPTNVQPGDAVALDGSTTVSSLDVATYSWSFGDGTTANTASPTHVYSKTGVYNVTLTVTDRGGNTTSLTQPITIGTPASASGGGPGGTTGAGNGLGISTVFSVGINLIAANLHSVLHDGIPAMVTSNRPADGFATISIPSSVAKRAHIHAGKAASVIIGRAIVSHIVPGTNHVRIHLGASIVSRLRSLSHAKISIRIQLTDPTGQRQAIDAARTY
jgi:PKD repeat protein